jgi:hypothetical protein
MPLHKSNITRQDKTIEKLHLELTKHCPFHAREKKLVAELQSIIKACTQGNVALAETKEKVFEAIWSGENMLIV